MLIYIKFITKWTICKTNYLFINYYFNSQDLSINFKCFLKQINMIIFIQFFFYINVLNNEKSNIFTFELAFKYNKTIQSLIFFFKILKMKNMF